MQSAKGKTKRWLIDWDVLSGAGRWENNLMGWASSADYMQATQMNFRTKEDAIAFVSWFPGMACVLVRAPAWDTLEGREIQEGRETREKDMRRSGRSRTHGARAGSRDSSRRTALTRIQAERQGWDYQIQATHKPKIPPKNYGEYQTPHFLLDCKIRDIPHRSLHHMLTVTA